MSAELLGLLGFAGVFFGLFMGVFSTIDYFVFRNQQSVDLLDKVYRRWGTTIWSVILVFVGFVFMGWTAAACAQRGYSDHEFAVSVNDNHAKLRIVTPEFATLDNNIKRLQNQGLNKSFNRQFEDGEVIKLRIYENYVAGLVFETHIELVEDK